MAQYGLTPQGPNIKRLDVIVEEMHERMSRRLGVNTRLNPQSLLNHLLTNVGDQLAELWEYGSDVYHSQYPATAEGVSLDNAAQFGGTTREAAEKSYYRILCTGVDGTVIPDGTLIASDTHPAVQLQLAGYDGRITRSAFNRAVVAPVSAGTAHSIALDGTLYAVDAVPSTQEQLETLARMITGDEFTATADGETLLIEAADDISSHEMVLSESLTTRTVSSVVTFATLEDGDIFLPSGVVTQIIKAVAGLESVVNVGSYIAGQPEESDVAFRKSYANKIYHRSSGMLESIRSAILENVQGVRSVAAYENDTNEVDEMGRWPHSVEIVADGGDTTAIAKQIFASKSGGISTYGSVETELPGLYGEPVIIRFNRPTFVNVWFRVGVMLSKVTHTPTNYVELIKEQILEHMEALESGDSVIPQKFHLSVPGIDYMDIWLYATLSDGDMPTGYDQRVVTISARERAVTDENRIEVVIDG